MAEERALIQCRFLSAVVRFMPLVQKAMNHLKVAARELEVLPILAPLVCMEVSIMLFPKLKFPLPEGLFTQKADGEQLA